MGWTTPKTWVSAEVLTAVNLNTHLRDNLAFLFPVFARKPSDESVISSTSLQDDNHLVLAVEANTVYELTMNLKWDAATAGDLKWVLNGPAGATLAATMVGLTGAAASNTDDHTVSIPLGTNQVQGGLGAGTDVGTLVHGLLVVAGTAGNLTLQWAQSASSGTATRVFTGSFLNLARRA